jgi:hypothetical protein
MQRALVGLCAVLLLAAVGCSSDNDRPETADGGDSTTTAAEATTTTGGGPFGSGATTTTDTTGTGGEGEGAGEGDPGETPEVPTGSGSVQPTSPVDADTPSDLSDAVDGCANYADVSPAVQQPGTSAEGTCEFGGEIINLYLFEDADAQRAFVEDGAFFDCSFIVAFGGGGATYYVAGDRWIARPGTEGVARDLAAALDGEVAAYTCEA